MREFYSKSCRETNWLVIKSLQAVNDASKILQSLQKGVDLKRQRKTEKGILKDRLRMNDREKKIAEI